MIDLVGNHTLEAPSGFTFTFTFTFTIYNLYII